MNRVLRKRILRDVKSNFMRYLALILLIVMGMYIVVSMVGSAETIMDKQADLAAGVIVMILFTYVISVFVMHQIQRDRYIVCIGS